MQRQRPRRKLTPTLNWNSGSSHCRGSCAQLPAPQRTLVRLLSAGGRPTHYFFIGHLATGVDFGLGLVGTDLWGHLSPFLWLVNSLGVHFVRPLMIVVKRTIGGNWFVSRTVLGIVVNVTTPWGDPLLVEVFVIVRVTEMSFVNLVQHGSIGRRPTVVFWVHHRLLGHYLSVIGVVRVTGQINGANGHVVLSRTIRVTRVTLCRHR